MTQPPHRSKIIDFFRNDCWRKLVALFLALLLYLSIAPRTGEKHEKTFKDVPVDIELPTDFVFTNNEVHKVKITLSGNARTLDNIDPAELNIRAEVNPNQVFPGEPYHLRLRASNVKNLPYGVRVSSISPRELTLDLDKMITKSISVNPTHSLEYDILSVDAVPPNVIVTGPERLLKSLDVINTFPIELHGDSSNHVQKVKLDIPFGLKCNRSEIKVTTRLNTTSIRNIEVPVKVEYPSGNHNLQVSGLEETMITVPVKGPTNDTENLPDNAITAKIKVDNDTPPGEQTLKVEITVSPYVANHENITLGKHTPENIKVNVINPQVKKDELESNGKVPGKQ